MTHCKTGTDLLICRTMQGLTQGQLSLRTGLTSLCIKDYETTGRKLPDCLIEHLGSFLDESLIAEGRRQQDQVYVITVTGMTEFQFTQKMKGIGKYVVDCKRTEQVDP